MKILLHQYFFHPIIANDHKYLSNIYPQKSVSYTHLDVYKRQLWVGDGSRTISAILGGSIRFNIFIKSTASSILKVNKINNEFYSQYFTLHCVYRYFFRVLTAIAFIVILFNNYFPSDSRHVFELR